MSVFIALFDKMLPLYGFIGLGYIAGKYLKVQKESVATLLIYTIVPVVVFTAVATTKITPTTIALPAMFFLVCCLLASLTYYVSGLFWKNATRNIIGFISGSANTGYFGLPAAVALFGNQAIVPVVLTVVGTTLYNNTFGFFLAAKGNHTTTESLKKVRQLPVLYAFLAGIIISALSINLGSIYLGAAADFNGAFIILGMMLVGMGLADINKYEFDKLFIGISLLVKFILWPLAMLAIVVIDSHTLQIFDPAIHKTMILMAIVPVAANTVAYATVLKTEPEKASIAVFISTIFAIFYVPLVAALFF
jgi:malate permease and related proteins